MLTAAIIGAGPAGSAAAITLARLRPDLAASIVLLEAKLFPRPKVCGEFVSPAATANLESLLSPEALLDAGARRVDQLVLEVGDRSRQWLMPTPAWVLSRRALDDALLERVREAGVRVLHPARVAEVLYLDGGVELRLADGTSLAAAAVVHADGVGRHDPSGPTPNRRGVVGLKCHLRPPVPIHGLRMRACRGGYVGLVQVESGEATCALVARKALIARHRGDADALLAELWPGYRPAWRTGDWLTCGVPGSAYRAPGHPRSFRIGNAAAAVEPVGGEGIGLALWSGARLAELLAATTDFQAVQRTLAHEYRARLRLRRPACRLAAAALMHPGLVHAAWPALAMPSVTIAPWYRLTGKPA